jgi:F-type H+-transporting ATPase subunit epsilon
MKLKVMTPLRTIVDENISSVILPAKNGEMNVLAGHDLAVAVLKSGRLGYKKEEETSYNHVQIGEGCAEIAHEHVMVFTLKAEKIENHTGG